MTASIWKRSEPLPRKAHVVATGPTFTKGQSPELAPLECSCGDKMTVADWQEHAKRTSVSRAWSEPPPDGTRHTRAPINRPNLLKTHCPRNHEYSTENTYVSKSGARSCKACSRISARRYYLRDYRVIAP